METKCYKCGWLYGTEENTKNQTDHYSTLQCPGCSGYCTQCLHCPMRYHYPKGKIRYGPIKSHVDVCHPGVAVYSPLDIRCQFGLGSDEATMDNGVIQQALNEGIDTETDFLGDNDPSDDCMIDQMLGNDSSDDVSLDLSDHYEYELPEPGVVSLELESFKAFSNQKSNVYFWQEFMCNNKEEMCGGLRGVVWRSMFQRRLYDPTQITNLPDSRLLFNMTEHYKTNTFDQNETFFEILEDVFERATRLETKVTIPFDQDSANKILNEHEFGIFGNLPHEEVFRLSGHACVSLIGIFKHMYAHKIPIGFVEQTDVDGDTRDRSNTNGSPAMEALLQHMKDVNTGKKPTKYGSFLLWSDGFVRSFVKQKGNNVWILTITFADPNGSATSKFHTYCLAVGQSSNNHQSVIDHFLKEVEIITNGIEVFCPKEGKFVRIQMGLLAYIADRPERHAIINQADGGIFGKRTLWSAVIDFKNLPFCNTCFNKEIKSVLEDRYSKSSLPQCGTCCQWNMSSLSPANKKVKPSELLITEKYPTREDPTSPTHPLNRGVPTNYLAAVELDFEWMLCALRYAAHNVLHCGWNKGTTKSYLKSCAVPDRITDKMYERFHNMDVSDNIDGVEVQSNDYVPYVWRSIVSMSAWIDAGMHHIFHGIVATIMSAMEDVFVVEKKKEPFEDLVNPYLLDIQSLRLDWLHLKQLPKTQWLAEDELGFSRIMVFIYGQYFLNIKLRQSSNSSKGALLSMRQMIISLQVMVALLMSPEDPDVDLIDRHIKIFLSCCHRFTQLFYDKNNTPFWARTSNFPALLNLASQIRKYGPIRWYWEGTRERYIQTVKKVLISMRKTTSYFVRKMILMQKLTTMAWLKARLRRKQKKGKKDYCRMYYIYESMEEIRTKFEEGDVLSGLTTMMNETETLSGHFWIAYGKKGAKINLVPIIIDRSEETSRLLCGMSYHKHVLAEKECEIGLTREEVESHASAYCLLLPYRDNSEREFHSLYGIIFSDWEVIDDRGNKHLPVLCSVAFGVDSMSLF